MNNTITIAIDGPSGAGKSTIAKELAKELDFLYLDTGALYRAIAYVVLSNKISPDDYEKVDNLLNDIELEIKYVEKSQHVFVNGEDVNAYIRSPEVSMATSTVSANPKVRAFLFDLQRNTATTQNVIMDGRDIGTVVLPDATVKIFLTASVEERARRRFLELQESNNTDSYEDVLADMMKRDHNDANRETAPLKQAEDAILVDSSNLDQQQTVTKIKEIVRHSL